MLFIPLLIFFMLDAGLITLVLFDNLSTTQQLIIFLSHLFFSLLAIFCLEKIINKFYPKPMRAFYLFLLLFNLAIPILGMVFAISLTIILLINSKKLNRMPLHNLDIKIDFEIEKSSFGVGGAVARLGQYKLPLKNRIEALLKISSIHQSKSNKYVQALLSDDEDELRLLAFEILEQQQKRINVEIAAALRKIEQETLPLEQAKLYKKVAFWYWELIYQNLIDRSFYGFCLNEALQNAEAAISQLNEDSELWVLLGKIYVRYKFDEKAAMAYKQAIACGAPALHIVPYYAEKQFNKRNFSKVKEILLEIASARDIPTIGPVIRFWIGKESI